MSYLALARKWRPRDFSQLVGQSHVARALCNALDRQRLHPALLFSGTRGVGKTTIARILAKSLNCERGVASQPCGQCTSCHEIDDSRFVDLIEVDAASRTRVDDTRELLDNVQYVPTRGRYKVYLIDEVHMLSNHSFNALLKTLEEPPPHVQFLLATTEPQKLPVTILSRCLQFNLKRLPQRQIVTHLSDILAREDIGVEQAALGLIAQAADGSMRDALSLLDQAIAFTDSRLVEAEVAAMLGTIEYGQLTALISALAADDGPALVQTMQALDQQAPDYDHVLSELAALLQRIALDQMVPPGSVERAEAPDDWPEELAQVSPENLQLWYQAAIMGRRDLQWAPDPRTGFEMTLLRMLAFQPAAEPAPRPAASRAQKAATAAGSQPAPSAAVAGSSEKPSAGSAAASTSEPASSAGEGRGLDALKSADWGDVVEQLRLRAMTDQLARNCAMAGVEGQRVKLVLSTRCRELLTEAPRRRLEQSLRAHYDADLQLAIEIADRDIETPAQRLQRQQAARSREAQAAIESDPHVQTLRDRFGATVRPGSVLPLNDGDPDTDQSSDEQSP